MRMIIRRTRGKLVYIVTTRTVVIKEKQNIRKILEPLSCQGGSDAARSAAPQRGK